MLDEQERKNYNLKSEMPVIQPYIMDNISNIINLSLVLNQINESALKRIIIYMTVITSVYAVNFLYLMVFVHFLDYGLQELGSHYYITSSFFDFGVLFLYLIIISGYGAQANEIDYEIKNHLMRL